MNINPACLSKLSLIVCCCVCLLSSCKDKAIPVADGKIVLADSESAQEIRYDDERFIESWSMVKLEFSDNSIIGEIQQLKLFEDRLYILDRRTKELAVFEIDGSFSHKIGAKGRGPQEHLALCSFYINPDKKEITLFDAMIPRRALIFDLDGKFIANKDIPEGIVTQSFTNMSYIGNGQVVCYADPNDISEDVLFILNEDDMTVTDILATRPMELADMVFKTATQPYSIVNGKLHYVKWFDSNIYEWDRGVSKPLLTVDAGKPMVPKRLLAATAKNNSGNYFSTVDWLVDDGKYFVGLRNLYETSRFIFCEFRNDGLFNDLLAWDKELESSVYITQRPSMAIPDIRQILFSSDDKLVVYWHYGLIERFQNMLKNGKDVDTSSIDPHILETLKNYDATEDNPLLFIYDIKK